MQRFKAPLLLEVHMAMRTPGGKPISNQAWGAIRRTKPEPNDQRLRDARGWLVCAYGWRVVCFAMHAHAKLDAHSDDELP